MWHHGSINRAYRLVFNRARGTWAVAPETARGQGKAAAAVGGATVTGQFAFSARRLRLAILAGLGLLALPSSGFALDAGALPSGGQVIAGQADIGQSGTSLTVNQGSDRAIIDWQSFDIGKDASVRFNQPGAHAAALNRVTGGSRSQILGNLSANGQVYLVNGAGVLFGQSAQVDVGGIVASTLAISNEDFLAGKDRFTLTENSTGEVINQGSITATNGTVALLGTSVSNTGNIQADGGNAILAAGREITFAAGADGHLQIAVDASELQLAVHNGGAIVADGGQIVLNAQGANALASAVVSNSGTLQARTLAEREGRILLLADLDSGGRAEVAGTLDASAPAASNPKGGNGGFVETSAAKVSIAAGTRVSTKAEQGQTGTWLIDPTDFTVAAGSATKTDSGIGAETLNANLANTSVTLQTVATGSEAGDINVDAAVAWNSDTTLTLNAHGDININAAITATGESAGLVLNHGGYAQNGTVASGSDYNISAPVTLSGSNASLSINGEAYTLIHSMTQLDAIDSTGLGGRYALAQDLDASGTTYGQAVVGSTFTGIFAGLGHSISDLTIESAHGYLGLFGSTGTDALIRDIGLLGGSVTGTGTGYNHLGGLVGYNYGGTISNAYATGSVTGTGTYNYLGGLVGLNYYNGTITNAYATGSVTGTGTYNRLGGLVGYNNNGTISNAYATGSVNSTGTYNHLGGLVGLNYYNGTITNAYATGSVNGTGTYNRLGGLVGYNDDGTISYAHWDSGSTGQSQAVGTGTSATNTTDIAANRYAHTAYASFGTWSEDAPGVWVARDADGAPQWVMLEGSTRPFLYSEYSTSIGNAHQLQLMALDLTATYTLAADIDASATDGSNASGMWSTAGFDPIGDASNAFTGSLDGQGHVVFELSINRASESYVGLIGHAGSGSSIRDIGLTDAEVNGGDYVGVLVGSNSGSIGNAWSSGSVSSGGSNIGGLAGSNQASGSIDEASSAAEVSGANVTGGLVGQNHGSITGSHASGSVTATTDNIGGLVGWSGGSIADTYASGSVQGANNVGGLVGGNSGSIDDAHASGSVSSSGSGSGTNNDLGGLVGYNDGGTISNAYATGSVTSSDVNSYLGGLVGYNNYGTITNAYATGSGTGSGTSTANYLGGLVGYNNYGTITNAYATGSVTGTGTTNHLGGLVGFNDGGTISNAYATGSVTGTGTTGLNVLGGLVGYNYNGTITNAYATGSVNGSSTYNTLGGLVGFNDGGMISDAFYATTDANGNLINSGSGYNALGTAKTLAELQDLSTFAAWGSDIDAQGGSGSVWRIYDGYTTPLLRSFLTQVTVSADLSAAGKTYDGSAASGTSSYTTDLTGASLDGSLSYATDSKNAGTYSTVDGNLIFDGLYSGQQGYDIRYANAELAIDKADLTVTGLSANNKTYDGTAAAALSGTANVTAIGADQVAISGTGTGAFDDKNAGTGKAVTVTGYTLSGIDADNYNLLQPTGLTATINKAQATVTANSASVTYNGQQQNLSGFTASGLVNGETESVLAGVTTSGGNGINAGSYLLAASGSDGNYTLTFVDGALTIDKAALTVTANDAGKTYDGLAWSGGNGLSYSGFVNGENESVLGGSLAYGGDAQGATNAGSYALDASGLTAGNYAISYQGGTLAIGKAQATVTANSASVTYNGQQQNVSGFTASGLVNGESESVLAGVTTGGGSGTNAGSYLLTASGSDGNYNLTFVDGALTIGKAQATVIANSANVTYNGQQQNVSGFTASGLVNGESESVLGGVTTNGGSGINAGSYLLTASGSDGNYALTFVDGVLIIDKAALTVTANDAGKTYNGLAWSGGNGVTYSGFVNGENQSVLDGTLVYGGTAQGAANAGSYALDVSGLTAGNYAIRYQGGNLTIGKAQATVTANSASVTYNGQQQSVAGFTANGLVNGETESVLGGITTSGGSGINAGSYLLTASGSDGNYALTFVDGALTIGKSALTVTANDAGKTYDAQPWIGGNGVTYSGFVGGETDAVLGGDLVYGGSAQGAVQVGDYSISVSGLAADNYAIAYLDGRLLIEAQPEVPPLPGTPAGPTAGDIERPVRQDERERLARVGMAGDGAARLHRSVADLPLQLAENFIRLEE
ncbi:MBG domain-containing protein [Phytopseudomonas dryadis]|uniref:Filamentous haemagglutinin FhaB/tRNA nuclease CdiA-like TPS domain-containing protein n=1 Tax=Phytopseudomonas dryadis TaxID=2487520 RepID=A0ABY1Z268_9GAMM|nr:MULTISPECIES: MBG domain-containing protein [Pseudomonas]TBV01674.1 hypothetical protein DNK34_20670 [Pseudomonas dryadis]TBV14165.1 hypothetical protein DNK41_20465 [Pseudomonas sp. FRB 230]